MFLIDNYGCDLITWVWCTPTAVANDSLTSLVQKQVLDKMFIIPVG